MKYSLIQGRPITRRCKGNGKKRYMEEAVLN
jgi:hypothetical protein